MLHNDANMNFSAVCNLLTLLGMPRAQNPNTTYVDWLDSKLILSSRAWCHALFYSHASDRGDGRGSFLLDESGG